MGGGGGQGEWERRSEAFVKIKKNIYFFLGGVGSGGVRFGGGGGQGGWEQRSETCVKIEKKKFGGGGVGLGGGVTVDENGELKLL